MTCYVPTDLEQVGIELARRAAELTSWLDSAALGARPGRRDERAQAIAEVDLSCCQALSHAVARLAAAASALSACASDMRATDGEIARRLCHPDTW